MKTLLSAPSHGVQTKVSLHPICRPLGVFLAPPQHTPLNNPQKKTRACLFKRLLKGPGLRGVIAP